MEKQEIWDNIAAQINRMCDKLGKPIDAGVKETVIVLQSLGFNTKQSCEGHEDRGLPYPWIKIECNEYYPDAQAMLYIEDIKIAEYLDEFYLQWKSLRWARLSLTHLKGSFTIQSFVGRTAKKLRQTNPEEYKILRENCSKEMHAFTEFLKEKFWNQ